jgi:hypothetical protein
VLIPFVGYKEYMQVQTDLFARYDVKVELPRRIIFENTGLYFILGMLVTSVGVVYGRTYPLAFPLVVAIVSFFLVFFAVFEVDVMLRFPTEKLHWHYWKAVPSQVAKTEGRQVVMLGMYQAGLFYLAGLLITYLIVSLV